MVHWADGFANISTNKIWNSRNSFNLSDVEAQISYLFDSPSEYLESIGFDPTKFQARELARERISGRYLNQTESTPTSMAARHNGQTIAAVFLHIHPEPRAHFHIFDPSLRGQGLVDHLLNFLGFEELQVPLAAKRRGSMPGGGT